MDLKEQFTNAVVASVQEAVEMMLSSKPELTDTNPDLSNLGGVICSIGFTGTLEGSIAISLSEEGSCKVVSKMLEMEINEINSDVTDGVGEIANMIAGGAKTRMTETQHNFEISLPTVIQGQDLKLTHTEDTTVISLGFKSEVLDFCVVVMYRLPKEGKEKKVVQVKSEKDAGSLLDELIKEDK